MSAAIWTSAAALWLLALSAEAAAGCRNASFEGTSYTICEVDPAETRVELRWSGADGQPLGTFDRLADAVPGRVVFAMNGGMYHPDRRPVGLFIEAGDRVTPVVRRAGPGNFGLLPNGILCLRGGDARVLETSRYEDEADCDYATQSGPMLVIGGQLHPRFIEGSDSRHLRNGVGVTADGRLVAAISNEPVNFHDFARLFRDGLGTPDALYLDGSVSRLWAPGLRRRDIGFPMGPMLVAYED